jgi:hypothetical protein
LAALKTVVAHELNVRQTEELVRRLSGEKPALIPRPAPSPEIMMAAAVAADEAESAITGKVVSKSDNSLQIDGHAVLVTDSTVYVRNGAPARLADIQAGDEVSATCAKGADGSLVAIRIEVTAAAS